MKKKTFVLRMDPEYFKVLEKWAADEFRSLNGQIEYLLYNEMKKAKRLPKKKTQAQKNKEDQGL